MDPIEAQNHINWLRHEDIQAELTHTSLPSPWFPVYRRTESLDQRISWFSALVPPTAIVKLLEDVTNWDAHIGDGYPSVWTHFKDGGEEHIYTVFGNEKNIEPLVIHRSFHGIFPNSLELAQEFRLYHNLYHEPSRTRFLKIDEDGNETEAARYGSNFVEVRTDLLLKFCDAKQMALAVYVDAFRDSNHTLQELGLQTVRTQHKGENYGYFIAIVDRDIITDGDCVTSGSIVGKKYILPNKTSSSDDAKGETFQEFIIDTDTAGKPVRYTCNPSKLANLFGKNPEAPNYLTPVFFRTEVLGKYYADPSRYSVEDGYLRCGDLWGLRMDNDHADCVIVFLGDLGGLSEAERYYWLSFNIAPLGRKISNTTFKRGFMAQFADPEKPDLVFKHEYNRFNRIFSKVKGWDFFLPFHNDDKHFLIGLRMLSRNNQAEFDSQLLALTKLLIDSLNEKEITKRLTSNTSNEKGISKLERFLHESGTSGYEPHIKFLRVLQDLRSKSAAHRKGSSYEKLIGDLQMPDEGQQKVFTGLLNAAIDLVRFLTALFIPQTKEDDEPED